MNRHQFMQALEKGIQGLSAGDRKEILSDYSDHFTRGLENGKSEEEICASLGNPAEIARDYLQNRVQSNFSGSASQSQSFSGTPNLDGKFDTGSSQRQPGANPGPSSNDGPPPPYAPPVRKGLPWYGIVLIVLGSVIALCIVVSLIFGLSLAGRITSGIVGHSIPNFPENFANNVDEFANDVDEFANGIADGTNGFVDGILESVDDLVSGITDNLWNASDLAGLTADSYSDVYDATFEKLDIQLVIGRIEILPSDDDKIHLDYQANLSASLASKHRYEVTTEEGKLKFKQIFNNGHGLTTGPADMGNICLTLRVPAGYAPKVNVDVVSGIVTVTTLDIQSLEVDSVSANVTVSNTTAQGELEIDTTSGGIDCESLSAGSIELDTTSGGIKVNNAAGKKLEADSTSGAVTVKIIACDQLSVESTSGALTVEDFVGQQLKAESTSGRIGADNVTAAKQNYSTVSGSISVSTNSIDPQLSAQSISGSVDVSMLNTASFSYDADTTSGAIFIDGNRGEKNMSGTVGNGGGKLTFSTTSGSITVTTDR